MFNFFKKKPNIRNCHHEDFAALVEPAFVGAGVHSNKTQYYRFKGNNELDMSAGRYNKASKFFVEARMKMSSEDLDFYIQKLKKALSGNEVSILEVGKIVGQIEDRNNLLLEEKTALKLASASFFDENEVLDSYDYEYNLKKIRAWEDSGEDYSFFFISPMSDLLPLPGSFQKDFGKMKDYLTLVSQEIMSHTSGKEEKTA